MPLVKYIEHDGTEHELHVEVGQSVMQAAVDNMVNGIVAECGGSCVCATCHCYVDEIWYEKTGEVDAMEREMIECTVDPRSTNRLSCQITMTDELDGLVVRLPESQF
jgi:2Fe-2S ferredoxin